METTNQNPTSYHKSTRQEQQISSKSPKNNIVRDAEQTKHCLQLNYVDYGNDYSQDGTSRIHDNREDLSRNTPEETFHVHTRNRNSEGSSQFDYDVEFTTRNGNTLVINPLEAVQNSGGYQSSYQRTDTNLHHKSIRETNQTRST